MIIPAISNGNTLDPARQTVIDTVNRAQTGAAVEPQDPGGFAALGQGDFLQLMVAQLQQQDPFEPVDNKEMLAQMAQFSSLAGTTQTNETLADIATKLDALIAAQKPLSATQEN